MDNFDADQLYTHINWGGKYKFTKRGDLYRITIVEYSTKRLPVTQQEMHWASGLVFDEEDFNTYFKKIEGK